MYKVSFHAPPGKSSPIEKLLNSCPSSLRAKIVRQLRYAQEFGLTPVIPNLKKITNTPLWELRILGKDSLRIICVSLPNKEIKVLHIFKKKKQKTPAREINLALKRYQEILDQ